MYSNPEEDSREGSNNELASIELVTKITGITDGETSMLDKAWETHTENNKTGGGYPTKGGEKEVNILQLSAQVQQLTKRLSNLEVHVHGAKLQYTKQESIQLDPNELIVRRDSDIIEAARTADALATVDRNLISSRPRNEGICDQLSNNASLLQKHPFAVVQCFVMLAAIVALLVVIGFKFVAAHNSVNDDYKPFKVDGKDEYYRNEKLKYELPLHYFWFQFAVSEPDFSTVYNKTFNETCDDTLEVCLDFYLDDILNPTFALFPTGLPTTSPTVAPTTAPTRSPTTGPTMSPTFGPTVKPTSSPTAFLLPQPGPLPFPGGGPTPRIASDSVEPDVPWNWNKKTNQSYIVQQYTMMNDSFIMYNSPVSAHCMMTSTEDGIVTTKTVGLRNLTLHLDKLGHTIKDADSNVTDIFGMLIRLEFDDFNQYMSGKIMCDLYLEMDRLEEKFGGFAAYDILFMVSREEFNSGTSGVTEYIRSMKRVWRNRNDMIDQIYSYSFEETTFDGKSDFTAEAILVDERTSGDDDTMLNIEVYPYPTIVNYVSFDRYSYMDWLADVGGYYTIAFGIFFVFSARITKVANRKDAFQRRQGILPAFSLPHRNAEELSGLRTLVLASLGITEEAYFSGDYDHNFTDNNKRVY